MGRHTRAAALAAALCAAGALATSGGAQQPHHGAPAGGRPAVLTGTVSCAGGPPLGGAIVQVFHGSGPARHLMAAALTDPGGRFAVSPGDGTFLLEITPPGQEPHRQQVTLSAAPLDVGNVRLGCRALELDALVVNAERAAVELRSGATVVHARASAAAGGSIADLLRTVPGIEMDADGRIGMRGSTGVLVLMNGRRMPLTGDALVAFLRQMPASALERVEAGTTASAREGADGGAGVVNLVFDDQPARRTAMRSVAASLATGGHYMASATATGNAGDVLDWNATYSLSSVRPRTDSKTARWSLVPGDPPLHTDQDSRAREEHRLHSIVAGAAGAPTPSSSVGLHGAYSWMRGATRSGSAFLFRNAAGDTGASTTGSLLEHRIPSGELSAVASLGRGAVRFDSEARTSFADEAFSGAWFDEARGYRYMSAASTSRQRERGLRNDLSLRLPGLTLDAGQASLWQSLSAAHDATHFDATVSQAYRYQVDVHSGYLTAQHSRGGLRAEAGLRVEADRTRVRLDAASERSAVRLFPGLRGEWTDARRALRYRLAYARRIDRPGPEMLNPFAMGGDDTNEIVGNPSLLPEVSEQVELGVERHRPRWSLQLTPFVRWTRDPIRQIERATARGGATTTLENLTRARSVGADGSLRTSPLDRTVLTLAASVAHSETTAEAFGSSGVHATARLTLDVRVAGSTTAHLYAYGRSAQATPQGRILPAFTGELALTQRLAGERARVTLRLSDPLRSDRLEFRVADRDFTQESRRRTARPLLSLFGSYAVGGAPREDTPRLTERPPRIF